jgi:hypothetical protein
MIQFISFDSCELDSEFVNNESISPIPIFMTKKQRVTQVNSFSGKGEDREKCFYGRNNVGINILTKRIVNLLKLGVCPEAWQN